MIKYKIEKHKQLGCYVLWKESRIGNGFSVKGIYQGSKKECLDYLEELKKES